MHLKYGSCTQLAIPGGLEAQPSYVFSASENFQEVDMVWEPNLRSFRLRRDGVKLDMTEGIPSPGNATGQLNWEIRNGR
jgi:hypothetical protein